MEVVHHGRHVAKAVVRLPKTLVAAVGEQESDRLGVAVSRQQIAVDVEVHAEGIHLSPGVVLDAAAVRTETEGVARLHADLVAVGSGDGGFVVEPVAGVDPAVWSLAKRIAHAVGVTLPSHRSVEHAAFVGSAVTVGVAKMPDVGDAVADHSVIDG